MKRRVLRVWWGRAVLQRRREIWRAALICEIVGHGNPDPEELIGGAAHNVRGDDHHELAGVLLGVALGWRLEAGQLAEAGQAGQSRSFGFADVADQHCALSLLDRYVGGKLPAGKYGVARSEEHTSELQSLRHLVC